MKNLLLIFTIIGIGIFGLIPVNAAYYPNNYGNSSYYNNYNGGIGSYTIGCTTYYYSTRTRAQLYTQNICTTYNYQYTYPTTYQYYQPSYQSYQSTYTYPAQTYYSASSWYSAYDSYPTYDITYTDTGYGNNYNYSYGNSCYHQNGYQYCY